MCVQPVAPQLPSLAHHQRFHHWLFTPQSRDSQSLQLRLRHGRHRIRHLRADHQDQATIQDSFATVLLCAQGHNRLDQSENMAVCLNRLRHHQDRFALHSQQGLLAAFHRSEDLLGMVVDWSSICKGAGLLASDLCQRLLFQPFARSSQQHTV